MVPAQTRLVDREVRLLVFQAMEVLSKATSKASQNQSFDKDWQDALRSMKKAEGELSAAYKKLQSITSFESIR